MANYISQVTLPNGTSYDIRELFPHVGNCTVAASAAAKTVTIGNFKLYTGAWVVVKFSNTNSADVASLTLNVDGTGAKPIKYRNANLSGADLLIANRYTHFIYDGTNYQIVGDFDTNSNTYDRNRYKANIKAGTSALVAANIIVGKDGVFNHLKSGGSFDISYPILYLNGAVAAGETTNNSYNIINFTITTTQSISLTAYLPVFIKGTLSGKIFTPVSTAPLTQTVPTTDDGYQYMYLGNATSTSAVYLTERHPIYVFKNNTFGEIVHTASNVNGYTVGKSVPSNAVFTDTWTAMVGATSSANGSVGYVNAVPPKDGYNTKYLRADGAWAIPTNTDEKVKATKLAQSTAEAAYYPTLVSGAGTAGVSIFDSAKINHTPGTTSVVGNTRLILGNATASGTANNEEGLLKLYSPGTSYHTLKGASTSSIVEHTLPTTGGTILNDVTTSFTQTLSSGTKIGTIKINGTSTDLYCETNTNTDTKVTQSSSTTSDFRPLLLGKNNQTNPENLETAVTDQTYVTKHVFVQPSTGNLTLYNASGDSPSLIFRRGTLVNNLNDWKIYASGGGLYFAQSTANASSETWTNKMYFHPSDGNLYVGSTKVSLNGHTHSQYLPKTTYEWNKEISFGNSGYLKIGSFPMYDTNITIDINATTSETYHGTVVIATQNVSTTSMGSHKIHVYDDPTGNIATSLRIVWTSGSRNYDIYFVPQSWSKNLIHIRALGNYMDGATDICVSQTGTAPTTTSGLEPVNILSVTSTGNGNAVTKVEIDSVGNLAVTKGSTFLTSHQSVTDGDPTLSWGNQSTVATIGNTNIHVTMPSNPNTDTKVTSTANHYTPETVSGKDKTASASGATAAWSIDVVKGVTLNTDGKGHVTGLSVTPGKIPGNPVPSNNVTGSGTSGYLTKWNGTNTVTNGPQLGSSTTTFLRNDGTWATPPGTYTHPTYTRTDTTSTASPAHGGTFTAIDSVTSTNGHVTAVNVKTVTLPAQYVHPGKTQTDTTSTASPAHGGTFTVVDSVTRDTSGHVSGINVKTVTLPSDQNTDTKVKVTANTTTKGYLIASTTSPNGTAVEGIADTGVYLDTTSGGLCATNVKASSTVCANTANSNSAGGIALYGTDPTAYGIMFRGTTNSGKHGYVQSDWATYFTMNDNGTTRGWIFRRGTTNVASISGAGNAVFNGSVTVGGVATNTSGCRMEYNSSTQTLDFVFV